MKNIKKLNYKNLINGFLVLTVLASLLISTARPQVVDAITGLEPYLFAYNGGLDTENIPENFPVSESRKPVQTIWVVVTAYSSTPDQTDDTPCHTANDFDLCTFYDNFGDFNTIAGNGLKFNTRVRMPALFGDKEFVVRDRMNARYNYGRIDVWFPTREEAKKFGVRRVQMEIYN